MSNSQRRIAAVCVTLSALILSATSDPTIDAAASAAGQPAVQAPSSIRYVALGDSRAAGPMVGVDRGGDGCARDQGYPPIVAAAVGASSFVDVSCSGATTANIISTPQRTSAGSRPLQIDSVNSDTTLVTLSIGGNDIDWIPLVRRCFVAGFGKDSNCRSDEGLGNTVDDRFDQFSNHLGDVLSAIIARAPHARVYVVGNGGYFGSRGCRVVPVSSDDALWLDKFFAQFNTVLLADSGQYGAHFVDVDSAAVGHDACRGPDAWFQGNRPGVVPALHPNAFGERALADLVSAAILSDNNEQ